MRLSTKVKFAIGIIKNRISNKSLPLILKFKLTYRCNFQCKYCNERLKKDPEMDTASVKKIIKEAADLGCTFLALTGGEPLLRDDIGKIIDYAHSLGLYVHLNSNGSILRKKINDIKNIDYVALSFDGPKDVHDNNRKKGSYESTLSAMSELKKKKINFCTIAVIDSYNRNNIDFLLEKARRYGFNLVFQPTFIKDYLSLDREKIADVRKAFDYLYNKKKEGSKNLKNSLKYFDYFRKYWPKNEVNFDCWGGKLMFIVTPSGKVNHCTGMHENGAEDVLRLGLKKAISSLSETKCKYCWYNCNLDQNYLFSLYPSSIKNALFSNF